MSDSLQKRKMSREDWTIYNVDKVLWTCYHETIKLDNKALTDASLYEIREYFERRDEKGAAENKSR